MNTRYEYLDSIKREFEHLTAPVAVDHIDKLGWLGTGPPFSNKLWLNSISCQMWTFQMYLFPLKFPNQRYLKISLARSGMASIASLATHQGPAGSSPGNIGISMIISSVHKRGISRHCMAWQRCDITFNARARLIPLSREVLGDGMVLKFWKGGVRPHFVADLDHISQPLP